MSEALFYIVCTVIAIFSLGYQIGHLIGSRGRE